MCCFKLAMVVVVLLTMCLVPAVSSAGQNRHGSLELDGKFGISGGFEMQVREPSMCDGKAQFKLGWNRQAGVVRLKAKFTGLPSKQSLCYDVDPSTDWNAWPECVEDGNWQIWFVGHFFTKQSTFYYDGASGDLLYNEFDVPEDGLAPGAIPVRLPVGQMICTEDFASHPRTLHANVAFAFDYHQILDARGTAGVFFAVVPKNLNTPSDLTIYYTEGGLPVSEAMDMDDILDELAAGQGGIVFATSLEPDPKPDFLASRDNLMIGWGADHPNGISTNPQMLPGTCGTFQWNQGFGQ